jgi:hypothetical protein
MTPPDIAEICLYNYRMWYGLAFGAVWFSMLRKTPVVVWCGVRIEKMFREKSGVV